MVIVPIEKLAQVKQILCSPSVESLKIQISDQVQRLQSVQVSPDFELRYIWSDENRRIEPRAWKNAKHYGGGWFITESSYWRIDAITAADDQWLSMESIEGKKIVEFLNVKVPNWKTRRVPVVCDLKYSDEPVLVVQIVQITNDQAEFAVTWNADTREIKGIPSLSRHVIVGDKISPGITIRELPGKFPAATGSLRLSDQEIPRFIQETWPKIESWSSGDTNELISRHKLLGGRPELILCVKRDSQDGIGRAIAEPTFVFGDFRQSAEETSRSITSETKFVRAGSGWINAGALYEAGIGPLGRAKDGRLLGPISLTPAEVINRGSARLEGPWSRLEFPEFALPTGDSVESTVRLHLEFLKHWGLPGGIVDTGNALGKPIYERLRSLISEVDNARVLLVGSHKALDCTQEGADRLDVIRFDGTSRDPEFNGGCKGVIEATPKALEAVPGLIGLPWHLLFLLEADSLIKSATSKLFDILLECRKNLVWGSFSSFRFLERPSRRLALSRVFNIPEASDGEIVWRYGLRNPTVSPLALPAPYQIHGRLKPASTGIHLAEFTLGGQSNGYAQPIPLRSPSIGRSVPTGNYGPDSVIEGSGISLEVTYSSGAQKFFKDAMALVKFRMLPVPFMPFKCYWPTYDSMAQSQRNWYFYWRDQVRNQRYIDTDLSYIFVHVYELINNIGVKDPIDGYGQLRAIWLNYRERFRGLDTYLVDWITDYIVLNGCPVNPLQTYYDALSLKIDFLDPDILLARYVGGSLSEIPLPLLDQMSDYRIHRSKFYREGNENLVKEYVAAALNEVNSRWLQKTGKGILEIFSPPNRRTIQHFPFQSAIYAGGTKNVTVGIFPAYTQHEPLREFITSFLKHSENKLREIKNYKGRLRGYDLDPEVRAVIDNLISGAATLIIPPPPKPVVTIDPAKVLELSTTSDEVRDLLLSGAPNEGSNAQSAQPRDSSGLKEGSVIPGNVTPSIKRPDGTPDNLLTDLDPVDKILSRLDLKERRLIELFKNSGWEMDANELRLALPDLDVIHTSERINELSRMYLSDNLIVSEDTSRVIVDDYRDELEYLFSIDGRRTGDTDNEDEKPSDLPPEWMEFSSKLEPYQLRALRAVVEHPDPYAEIRTIAEENAVLPEALIDSINTLASDTVGDVIIAPGSSPPVVEEEDLDFARKLVSMNK
ncbi:MAG: TerB N-terminal domain-containing protein [Acidobacteriia bacterium]|nr:TerB N-terminal domain-containing protein [Terriglobia bacterium]